MSDSDTSDFDKTQWQAEQTARDAELEKQREREKKTRERSARNARRKLARLHRTLKESGEITDFEDEFSESVGERLDTFGAAFANPELGRPGDALSASQKRVLAAMNRKVKDARKRARQGDGDASPSTSHKTSSEAGNPRRYSSFQNKRSGFKPKSGYTPRVRQLDEDFDTETAPTSRRALETVIPPENPPNGRPPIESHPIGTPPAASRSAPVRPPVGKPFLRIVK